ncbi:MAG: exonuclease domain-containing protein [Firmicutes bacterium]|nr:exonuclease domain-containing protein [Bacillota bacterium]
MTEYVYGILHGVDEKKRIIAIKGRTRVRFYYMAKGMFLNFMLYFNPGIFIFMDVQKNSRRYRGLTVQNVINIEKILLPKAQHPKIYYDVSLIKSEIKTMINSQKPRIFLDFEMSMPPFRNYQNFVSEIIQVGLVLTDSSGTIIEKHSMFIKPVLHPEISDRTQKFLHIDQSDIINGVEYPVFYRLFQKLIRSNQPMVFVWGQNDQIELKKMNSIHQLIDFTPRVQFIDLLKMHKTYFGLKNDLGLFNAYKAYASVDLNTQMHDAFEDAMITKKVFDSFLDICNQNIDFVFPSENNE